MHGEVRVFDGPEAMAGAAAHHFRDLVLSAVGERNRCLVALSGGHTPLGMYRALAESPLRDEVPWDRVELFWSDERYVPPDSPQSNFGAARAELLARVPIPEANVHPVPTGLPPREAGAAYDREVKALLGDDRFDVVLLGIGGDGHIASLFPGTQALYNLDRGVVAHWVPSLDAWRITFTLSEINAARDVVMLVSGAAKAAVFADVRTGASGLPAARVNPTRGHLVWMVDRAAAGGGATTRMKRAAAAAAAAEVSSGMLLGLGTGSTASYALEGIAERLRWGEIEHVIGVPTSEATAARARSLGIPLTTLEQHPRLDLAIDGADEVDGELRMIKGGGGALLREKIVAWSAARRVIVVDEGKRVEILGRGFPLPVEVLPFGWSTHESAFRDLGGEPQLRTGVAGSPYLTDNGNYVIDCRFPEGIDDPNRLHRQLIERPGIVETGIFAGEADALFVGREAGGVEIVTREGK